MRQGSEANARVGGRTLNHQFAAGDVVEVGGQWVGPTQDRVLALLRELALPTFPLWNRGNNLTLFGGKLKPYRGTIPHVLTPDINVAYTDTDGNGQRGDRRPPGAEKYYPQVDEAIRAATGKPATETVVMTADYGFLALYPYYGFQGSTSHYANPLAQFDKRTAAIESWGQAQESRRVREGPRRPAVAGADGVPDAPGRGGRFGEHHTLRLAEDVYPNQPNVRRYTVDLDAGLFAAPHFTVKTIGPFVLAIRNRP